MARQLSCFTTRTRTPMFSRLTRMATAIALPLTIALPALAGLPAAIDRVPNDALAVFSIRSISELKADLDAIGDKLPPFKEALNESPLGMVMAIPGINTEGSIAGCILGDTLDPNAGPPPMVVVIPVTDAKQFFEGLNLTAEGDIWSGDLGGSPASFKDIGGGFVAMSQTAELLATFNGEAGKGSAHTERLGKSGSSLADSADILVFADLAKLKTVIDQGMAQMKSQLEMVSAMAGPNGEQMMQSAAMMESLANLLTSDGDLAIFGTSITGAGIAFDAGAQFKDGTETYKALASKGDSSKALARVPNIPYLVAFSADTSSPFVKEFIVQANKMQGQGASFLPSGDVLNDLEGMSFVLGTSPALMGGGLFANSVIYMQTKDAPGLVATMKDMTEKMNGTSNNGLKLTTSYKSGDATVAGTSVDTWSVRMAVDPNDPNAMAAQQVSQAMMMIWGPSMGPTGYLAATKSGLVETLSKNTMLLEKALQVAESGDGLGKDAALAATAEHLPKDRSAEVYIGVGEIIKTVGGVMAMMGMGMEMHVPENLPPVGMAITTVGGSAGTRFYIPMEVITAVADIQNQMSGGGEDMAEEPDAEEDASGAKPKY